MIDITANDVPGRFEIDTTMIAPGNRLVFILGQDSPIGGVVPDFVRGEITILGDRPTVIPETPPDSEVTIVDPQTPPDSDVAIIDPQTPPDSEIVVADPPIDDDDEDGWTEPAIIDSTVTEWSPPVSVPDTMTGSPLAVKNSLPASAGDATDDKGGYVLRDKYDGPGREPEPAYSLSAMRCRNYPNPFNAATSVQYTVSEYGWVQLIVYNALGQTITMLEHGYRAPGEYVSIWDGTDQSGQPLPSGVYFYLFQCNGHSQLGKMTILR